jgi:hypothetical protein
MAGIVGLQETGNGDKLELNAETLLTGRGYDNPLPGWTFVPDIAPLFPVPPRSSVSQIERAHLCPGTELESKRWIGTTPINPERCQFGSTAWQMPWHLSARYPHRIRRCDIFVYAKVEFGYRISLPLCVFRPEVFTNVAIEIPAAVHPVFMLTRLAWAILPELHEQRGEVDCQVETVFRSRGHKRAHWRRAARHPRNILRSNSPQKEAERGYNLGRCRDTRCNFEATTPRFGYFDVNEE